jgi:hypothetical protein
MNIGQFTHKEQQLMREPKFRIWDRYKNEMVYGGFQLWFDGHGELKDTPPIGAYPNIELLEYTGLNDKHGKKIFEGDILLWNGWEGEVYWHEEEGAWWAKRIGSLGRIPNLEIIGNMYENAQLIPKDDG